MSGVRCEAVGSKSGGWRPPLQQRLSLYSAIVNRRPTPEDLLCPVSSLNPKSPMENSKCDQATPLLPLAPNRPRAMLPPTQAPHSLIFLAEIFSAARLWESSE